MITINLLPIGAFKEKYKGRVFLAGYILGMLFIMGILFSVKTNKMDSTLENLKGIRGTEQNTLTALQQEVTKASKQTTSIFNQWQQLIAILEIEERRRDQTRLLVEVEALLPKSNAWLLSFSHNAGNLILEGISTDKETVSEFLSKLQNATYIDRESVTLVNMTQNMVINNIRLTKFRILAKTSFPYPKLIEDGMPEAGLPSRADFIKALEGVAPELVKNLDKGPSGSGRSL